MKIVNVLLYCVLSRCHWVFLLLLLQLQHLRFHQGRLKADTQLTIGGGVKGAFWLGVILYTGLLGLRVILVTGVRTWNII